MREFKRTRLFVDSKVQGALLLRVFAYWAMGVVTVGMFLLCWQIANGPDGPFWSHFRLDLLWEKYSIVALATVLLLPVLLLDTVRVSNRFAGPLFRMRRSMRALAAGEPVEPLRFRDKDFWQEMAAEFNAVVDYAERLKKEEARQSPAEVAVELPEHEDIAVHAL